MGGVARSIKMLSGKQVAALIKKQDVLTYLMISYRKQKFIKKIPEATKILNMFYEEYTIFIFTFLHKKLNFGI
jgi:hypothetical protein